MAHCVKIATDSVGRLINRHGRAIGNRLAFDEPEQVIHRVEFWSRARQETKLNAALLCILHAVFGRMRCAAIFKQNQAARRASETGSLSKNTDGSARPILW